MQITAQNIAQFVNQQTRIIEVAKQPRYQFWYELIKNAIEQGQLPAGCQLPATRVLAIELGVSRSTINKCYEMLRLDGLISSTKGSGSVISPLPKRHHAKNQLYNNFPKPQLSQLGKAFHQNIDKVNPTEDSNISFRPGLPPLDVFPVNKWKKLENEYWQRIRATELTYHSAMGMDELRKTLAKYLRVARGINCHYQQIAVVGGSLQSLFLVGSLLLDAGDGVVLEAHTFPNVHSVFSGLRANLFPAKIDTQGIDIESIKNHEKLKIIHTTPACQYPLGISLATKRRSEVIEFAHKNDAFIIENDYEHEANLAQKNGETLHTLDGGQRVIYVSTFNRILHPSIRIGFMVIPPQLVAPMHALIRHSHMFISPAVQLVLSNFIEKQLLQKHTQQLAKTIAERRQIFETIIGNFELKNVRFEFFNTPALHMLIHLPEYVEDAQIAKELQQKGIIVHTLSKCAVSTEKLNGLIVGYASTRSQHIKPRLHILLNALREIESAI